MPDTALEGLNALARWARAGLPRVDAWVVGGAVRDALIGRPMSDVDIVASGDVAVFAATAAAELDTRVVQIGEQWPLLRLPLPHGHIDIVAARGPIEEDLKARDFTMNALAVPLSEVTVDKNFLAVPRDALLDPLGGLGDLDHSLIRAVQATAIRDDPLRALRAVRFAIELGFDIEPSTKRLIAEDAPLLAGVAPERVSEELTRLLAKPDASRGVRLMEDLGQLGVCFPPLAACRDVAQEPMHRFDVFDHQLHTADWLDVLLSEVEPQRELQGAVWQELWKAPGWGDSRAKELRQHLTAHAVPLRIASLLHDVGKPATRTVDADRHARFIGHQQRGAEIVRSLLMRLRFPSATVGRVGLLVAQHLRPGQLARGPQPPSSRALRRLKWTLGDAVADLCWLYLADSLATRGGEALLTDWAAYVAHVRSIVTWERTESAELVARLIDGHTVMAATGLAPGPDVGRILRAIEDAAAGGDVQTSEEALAMAVRLASAGRQRS